MPKRVTWISTTAGACWKSRTLAARAVRKGDLGPNGRRHQTWQGMGGCFNELGWTALAGLSPAKRAAVVASLVGPGDTCRFNFCRLPIGASDYAAEWYSLNETDGDFAMKHFSIGRDRKHLIPYVKLAQRLNPALKFFASPWSPPTWLKFPKAMNNGSPIMDKKHLDALALYYVKYVEAYRREGIAVDQIHVLNEPASRHHKFPMCEWDGEGLRVFIRDHLGPAFRRHNIKAAIWLSTLNTSEYNVYVNPVLSDPKARAFVAGVGLQWEGRFMVRRIGDAWPGIPTLMTENECGDGQNTWEYAQYVFDMMYDYIAGGVIGYTYWNMVLPLGGESTWGWKQNSMVTVDRATGKVTYTPEFYVMKHFSRFVAPGATRIALEGSWAGTSLAFENPNGDLAVVVNNPFAEARKLSLASAAGGCEATLPPQSFNTFLVPGRAGQ